MARPTKSKDVKPKALEPVADKGSSNSVPNEESSSPMNMIIIAVIIVVCTAISSAASVYFLAPMVIQPLLAQSKGGEHGEEGEGEGHGEEGGGHKMPTVGPVIDLEEFTVNLKDPGGQRYLRADLSITVTAGDPNFEKLSGEAMHAWEENFHAQMGHYVPAIRDIVITALTKRTAAELSTAMGKEQIKEEIKKNTDGVFHGKHQVIRVNFENFIIQ